MEGEAVQKHAQKDLEIFKAGVQNKFIGSATPLGQRCSRAIGAQLKACKSNAEKEALRMEWCKMELQKREQGKVYTKQWRNVDKDTGTHMVLASVCYLVVLPPPPCLRGQVSSPPPRRRPPPASELGSIPGFVLRAQSVPLQSRLYLLRSPSLILT